MSHSPPTGPQQQQVFGGFGPFIPAVNANSNQGLAVKFNSQWFLMISNRLSLQNTGAGLGLGAVGAIAAGNCLFGQNCDLSFRWKQSSQSSTAAKLSQSDGQEITPPLNTLINRHILMFKKLYFSDQALEQLSMPMDRLFPSLEWPPRCKISKHFQMQERQNAMLTIFKSETQKFRSATVEEASGQLSQVASNFQFLGRSPELWLNHPL